MAITHLTRVSANSATSSNWGITVPSTMTAVAVGSGGLAIVAFTYTTASSVYASTVTDNAGNTYLLARRQSSVGAGAWPAAVVAEMWYAENANLTASTRVDIFFPGLSSGQYALGWFNGAKVSGALLESTHNGISVNSTFHRMSTGHVIPTEDNALVISVSRANVSTTAPVVSTNGWSSWVALGRTFGHFQIQTTASSACAPWRTNAATSTGACQHGGIMAVFAQEPPSTGGGEVVTMRRWCMGSFGVGA